MQIKSREKIDPDLIVSDMLLKQLIVIVVIVQNRKLKEIHFHREIKC